MVMLSTLPYFKDDIVFQHISPTQFIKRHTILHSTSTPPYIPNSSNANTTTLASSSSSSRSPLGRTPPHHLFQMKGYFAGLLPGDPHYDHHHSPCHHKQRQHQLGLNHHHQQQQEGQEALRTLYNPFPALRVFALTDTLTDEAASTVTCLYAAISNPQDYGNDNDDDDDDDDDKIFRHILGNPTMVSSPCSTANLSNSSLPSKTKNFAASKGSLNSWIQQRTKTALIKVVDSQAVTTNDNDYLDHYFDQDTHDNLGTSGYKVIDPREFPNQRNTRAKGGYETGSGTVCQCGYGRPITVIGAPFPSDHIVFSCYSVRSTT